jgi:hypothetical protein
MKKKLRHAAYSTRGNGQAFDPGNKLSRDDEYEQKKQQWEQQRASAAVQETRPQVVSAWVPAGEKDAYGNANFNMQKGHGGQ